MLFSHKFMKTHVNDDLSVNFSGQDVILNAVSAYGAQGVVFQGSEATSHLRFSNTGDVNITAVIAGNGIGRSNAIGIMGNWQNIAFDSNVDNVNVSVFGSGLFNGNALNSNGTSALFFAGDTVEINSQTLNISAVAGQNYAAKIQTGLDTFETVEVVFDTDAAKALGTSYGVTYGLNNKADTTIGANTVTTIKVSDGYWTAIGISNDPMYLDESSTYSNYNLSDLKILGDLYLTVEGSSIGDVENDLYTGTSGISVSRPTSTYGVYAAVTKIDGVDGYDDQQSTVVLGSEGKTVDITVSNNTQGADDDLFGLYGSKANVTVEGKSATITVNSQTDGTAYGAMIKDGTGVDFKSAGTKISASGEKTVALSVTASQANFTGGQASLIATGENSTAVEIMSNGEVTFSGTNDLNAKTALTLDSSSTVSVIGTQENQASLTANGLVSAQGKTVLENAVMEINGTGSELGVVNADSSTVKLGSGIYNIATFSGDGKALLLNDLTADISIGTKDGAMTFGATSAGAEAYVNADAALDALMAKQEAVKLQAGDTVEVAQTTIGDGLTAVVEDDGSLTKTYQKNSEMDAYGSLATLATFLWRHDMNDLTKRMGELRSSPEGVGSWARLYGSKQKYGAQSLTAKNTSVQVGADVKINNGWTVGAAFTYTDGETTYANGDSDSKSYGVGIYGSWLDESGLFVDLIAKYSRLDNDFNVNGMDGSFDNNGYSFSAEAGWHFNLADIAFVEPQAELTYGKLLGDDFTTGNGVTISQKDFKSLIGRIGVRSGFYFPENKGTIYARFSVLHDFEGEAESTASYGASRNSTYDDLGGTWVEYAVGANFNLTPNAYTYVDLERTSGGEVKEDWRFNVGLRYVW